MKKFLRLGLVVVLCSTYFVLAPFGYVAFFVLHQLPNRKPLRRARMLQGIMRRAFGLLHHTLRITGFIDYDPRRVQLALPPEPSVLVANHPTLVDVTSVLSAVPDVTTVVKPLLYNRFWARGLLRDARLFPGATSTVGLAYTIDAAVERLREGFHVLIFPEGTRSPADGLHPFGRTAFEIACRMNAPVVPLVIDCAPVWLSKEQPIARPPDETVRFTLRALPAVHPQECGGSSRRLRDVVEGRIRESLHINFVQYSSAPEEEDAAEFDRRTAQAPYR